MNYVATTDAAQDIEVVQDVDAEDVRFGLISTEAAGLTPDASGPEATGSDDEQIIALASVTSLPLRFAQGRDLMAQIQKRVLGDGLVWLGIPFRSQIDGGEFDHYIVISGLTPNGFVYNDAAFSTTLGYGLEISDVELEYAWTNSSIPHHALALGLDPDKKALSFPELPRKPRQVVAEESATARAMRRLAAADESDSERAPLLSVTPLVSGAPAVVADTTVAAAA